MKQAYNIQKKNKNNHLFYTQSTYHDDIIVYTVEYA